MNSLSKKLNEALNESDSLGFKSFGKNKAELTKALKNYGIKVTDEAIEKMSKMTYREDSDDHGTGVERAFNVTNGFESAYVQIDYPIEGFEDMGYIVQIASGNSDIKEEYFEYGEGKKTQAEKKYMELIKKLVKYMVELNVSTGK